jgi:ATP-dependent RNA helicase RhlE
MGYIPGVCMLFSDLGLRAEILSAVTAEGYTQPTPIQAQAIPAVLAGRDLMACAQTGTGKTAGFTLPILQLLSGNGPSPLARTSGAAPRVLILAPTRELAMQIEESVRTYGKDLSLKSVAIFGGVGINPQIAALRRGVDIVVATPGRLLYHMQQKTVNLSKIDILVLDEADRMLDMGFIRDIRKIIALLPAGGKGKRQNLLFSATFSDEIKALASSFLHDPLTIEVARRNTTIETVTQKVIHLDRERKKDALLHLFDTHGWNQVLIFARTKHGADALSQRLDKAGIPSAALHGNKSQGARVRALNDFKDGKLVALVATDIAARGIDIDALPYVINYELPNVPEDYVHRIGRTGRAGAGGEAFSLVSHDERGNLRDIERLIKCQLETIVLPGFEQSAVAPSPPPAPRGARPGGGRGQGAPRQGQGAAKPAAPGGRGGQPRGNGGPSTGGNRPAGATHRNGTRHH